MPIWQSIKRRDKLKNAKTFLYALVILINTTIGIGIFALPYAMAQAGIGVTLAYFLVLGAAVAAIHLMFGQVALATPDYKRLPGFLKIHIGKGAELYAKISIIGGFFASMVAFMLIGGQFLHQIFSPSLGGSELIYGVLYGIAGAILVYFGINTVSRIGLWGLVIFLTIFSILAAKGLPLVDPANFSIQAANPSALFLPYGLILYALWASSSIPEVEEMLGRKNRKDMLFAIIAAAAMIAVAIYAAFSLMIVGITGQATNQSALIGLRDIFGPQISNLLFFFGFITSFTSFIIMGLTLKKVLAYDCGLDKTTAWIISSLAPIIILCSGFNDFVSIFSFVGGVLLGADGILILLMYQKIRPKQKWMTYPLLLIFIGGIIYQLAEYLK